jgi:tRNA A-37 threonylcarbamoyl transferase component Bud32
MNIILLKCTWPILLFAGWFIAGIVLKLFGIFQAAPLNPFDIVGSLFALFFIGSYFTMFYALLKRDFILRQWGITLPLIYIWSSFPRLSWSWSQLVGVVFSRSRSDLGSPDQFILRFQASGPEDQVEISIKLKEIDQLDLKKMIYAIVTNAGHATIEPPLEQVALEFPTVSGIKHLNFQSFTNIWDEEFSTRYSPTLFVPLQPDHELRSGTIKITELVACGGSAAIYSAKNSDGQQIIVKEAVIPKNAAESLKAKAIELFSREALLLSKLDHPNIAKVFDHFVENEHHYEVLEFIDGLDLRRFVKERGPQPEDFVLNWAQQICEILIYLHTQDPPIIHRDLTPDNLVLRVDGQLVLIDFGAANAFVGIATGTMVGKQSYMPPEQLRGKSVPQSDIYSFGGTIYFLLTGKDPTPLEVSQIKEDSNLPTDLNPLMARCTAIEVADRYQSSQELLDDIRRIRQQRIVEGGSVAIQKTT